MTSGRARRTPTCPTGSGCAPSRRWSRASCSAYPTPTSCPAPPARLPQVGHLDNGQVQGGLRVRSLPGCLDFGGGQLASLRDLPHALYEPVIQRLREVSSPGIILSGDRDEGALLGNVRPALLPPGRGWLITRKEGAHLIQLAYLPPAD